MNPNAVLTKRENEIAELLAFGALKWQIAETLFISERTVENTARNIYEKVEINNAVELSVWYSVNNKHKVSFEKYHELKRLLPCERKRRTIKRRDNNLNCFA